MSYIHPAPNRLDACHDATTHHLYQQLYRDVVIPLGNLTGQQQQAEEVREYIGDVVKELDNLQQFRVRGVSTEEVELVFSLCIHKATRTNIEYFTQAEPPLSPTTTLEIGEDDNNDNDKIYSFDDIGDNSDNSESDGSDDNDDNDESHYSDKSYYSDESHHSNESHNSHNSDNVEGSNAIPVRSSSLALKILV